MSQPLVTDPKVKAALTRAGEELKTAAEEHRALSKRINAVVSRLYDIELNGAVRLQVDAIADTGDLHKSVSRRVNSVASVIDYLLTGGVKGAAKAAKPEDEALSAGKEGALTPEQIKKLLGES